ncbi:hypothetical protein TrVE_jg10348 [Triparma verrucosa]|uniref:Uncharacterized protein n=1 Tax=Triparma verrucosa TaxID=1606542 RepID=A0A9W7EZ56_9STRA|nr:hypothetical protein TrVE_jg10348 [Triparma verrucosa]
MNSPQHNNVWSPPLPTPLPTPQSSPLHLHLNPLIASLLSSQKETTSLTNSLHALTSEIYRSLQNLTSTSIVKTFNDELSTSRELILDEIRTEGVRILEGWKESKGGDEDRGEGGVTVGTQTSADGKEEDDADDEEVVPETQQVDEANSFQDILDQMNAEDRRTSTCSPVAKPSVDGGRSPKPRSAKKRPRPPPPPPPQSFKDLEEDFKRRKSPTKKKGSPDSWRFRGLGGEGDGKKEKTRSNRKRSSNRKL